MKKCIVAAFLLLAFGTAVHAEDSTAAPQGADDASKQKKDDCILNAKDCGDQALSIENKIQRLKEEIAKGSRVYTPKELQKLKHKLEDANDVLDELLFHPTNN